MKMNIFHRNTKGRLLPPAGTAPEINIIIPIYNSEKSLARCLLSCINQHESIKIICVNDCSTDKSEQIIDRFSSNYPGKFTVVNNAANMGAAASRNKGLIEATASSVMFIDSDDILPEGAINTLLRIKTKYDADIVRGNIDFRHHSGMTDFWNVQTLKIGTLNEIPELWIPWFHCCYLFSARLLRDNHIMYPGLRVGEDPVFLSRCLAHAKTICVIPSTVYKYEPSSHKKITESEILDYIGHVEMVRIAWAENLEPLNYYLKFIYGDLIENIDKCSANEFELAALRSIVNRLICLSAPSLIRDS